MPLLWPPRDDCDRRPPRRATRRLQWLGLAEVVLPRQLTASRLRQAVERVLGDPGYRERADERAREITGLDGVHRAADIVEEAFHTKRPVLAGR